MKILTVTYTPEIKFSSRLHMEFLSRLNEFCEYHYLHGSMVLEKGRLATDLYKEYEPDVVIHYDSHAPRGIRTRFPEGYFAKLPCLKVMIEPDFWKKAAARQWDDFSWYVSNKFDLIIRRGCFKGTKDVLGIPSIWLPYSADENEFYPVEESRRNVIGFAGAYKYSGIVAEGIIGYAQRRKAMALLGAENLLEHCKGCRTLSGSTQLYPMFLRSVVAALTSAETRSPMGKMFEIMASGTVLLTTDFDHRKELFGDIECFVEYLGDGSDVVEKAHKILNNLEWAKQIALNGLEVFKKNHTHTIRIKELYHHLECLLEGKQIMGRWE